MRVSKNPKVVILGAGFGGLAAAQALKNSPAQVTLIDRQNCHIFQPLLYQVATGALSPAEVAIPLRELFRGKNNITILMDEATAIDRATKQVRLRSGALDYDILIVATGSKYAYFGNPQWEARTLSLRSLADAITMRERILSSFERAELAESEEERRRHLSFAIVGGGATGVELAGTLADLVRRPLRREFRRIDPARAKIYLFEAEPALLPGFEIGLRDYTSEALIAKGVDVKAGTTVSDIRGGHVVTGDIAYEAGTVLWAAGINAGGIADLLGVEGDKHGRVPVRADLRMPEDEAVYVIGDAAHYKDDSGLVLPALAAVAQQQGTYVGDAILRSLDDTEPPEPFRYLDRGELAAIGRFAAVADLGRVRLTGWVAWITWWLVHIYFLIGFHNRLFVFMSWIWLTLTDRNASRLITGVVRTDDEADVTWGEAEDDVTEAGQESFPASDPPAYTAGTAGAPDEEEAAASHAASKSEKLRDVQGEAEDRVAEAGRESFPASDPPAFAAGRVGAPPRAKSPAKKTSTNKTKRRKRAG